jgi:transcription initiation factor TFIIF subunit alpha
MSDGAGGRIKKKSHLSTGSIGTPSGSRAGSPAPASGARSPATGPLTAQEMIDALPEDPEKGVTIATLLQMFTSRIGDGPGQMSRKQFIDVIKANSVFRKENRTLSRKKTSA